VCAFKKFHKARTNSNVIFCVEEIYGFIKLQENDQILMRDLIKKENVVRKEISKPKPKNKIKVEAPLHVRKSQLKVSNTQLIKILYTNADQLTTSKMTELKSRIQHENPLIIAICEVKPKNSDKIFDYTIPGYSLHTVNLDTNIGRGIAV